MKKIEPSASIFADPDGWHREWHEQRNAAVAELVADGLACRRSRNESGELSREEYDDDEMRWLFWRQHKSDDERSRSDRAASPDAYLYEGVTHCMKNARADERRRIAAAISNGLKAILGGEFESLLFDMADVNELMDPD